MCTFPLSRCTERPKLEREGASAVQRKQPEKSSSDCRKHYLSNLALDLINEVIMGPSYEPYVSKLTFITHFFSPVPPLADVQPPPLTTTKKPSVTTTAPAATTTKKPLVTITVPTTTSITTTAPSTTTKIPIPGRGFCQDKPDGTYANPDDKASFFVCAGRRTYLRKCGTGTVFDDSCKCCVWP